MPSERKELIEREEKLNAYNVTLEQGFKDRKIDVEVRVGRAIAKPEKGNELRIKYASEFEKQIRDFKIIPAGRILHGAGSGSNVTFFNCYVMPYIKDSATEIISEHFAQVAEIMRRGGGVGSNGSTLRPKAEPGIFFLDRANYFTNAKGYGKKVVATNPCGEQPLPPYSVCNLNNIIDTTYYFLKKNTEQAQGERRIGMGVMGLHDFLIYRGLKYGSTEANLLVDKLFETICLTAYKTSVELAQEKGVFPFLKNKNELVDKSGFIQTLPKETQEKIREHGLRNSHLLTVAPTGSTGTLVGVSTGLEPYFAFSYYRSGRLGKFIKTINAPKGYKVEQVKKIYETLYEKGAKGGTVYVDGCRDLQVLSLEKEENKFSDLKTEKEECKICFKGELVLLGEMNDQEKSNLQKEINEGVAKFQEITQKDEVDLIVVDEILGCIHNKQLSEEVLINILKNKKPHIAIALSGHNLSDKLKEVADLVSQVKLQKHYFYKGGKARQGIEY
ncbi:2936_t:CDS:2 [Funneliformis geosporum]|uniref:2936_t:CDS:1 n=1 Tax=Funneliformis geosporum TaxID=1117311 RepID=A0A9W4WPE0_9GLOM|nr:2936_t:CDS:2 [Funneliformis geosporum]